MMSAEQSITYEFIDEHLSKWSEYIKPEEFAILREFVYNTANDIPFNKLLIFCGPGNTGKTTLVNEISSLIGKNNCAIERLNYRENSEEYQRKSLIMKDYYFTKKLIIYNHEELKDIYDGIIKEILSRTPILSRELYQQAEYHSPTANQILVSNDISKLNEPLLARSNVIYFTHIF